MTCAETEVKSQSTSVIALTGFRVRLATRQRHDGQKGTRHRSSRRSFLEIHKFAAASRFFDKRPLSHDSPRFGRPTHFLLPGRCLKLAPLCLTETPTTSNQPSIGNFGVKRGLGCWRGRRRFGMAGCPMKHQRSIPSSPGVLLWANDLVLSRYKVRYSVSTNA